MRPAKWTSLCVAVAFSIGLAGCANGSLANRLRARGMRGDAAANLSLPTVAMPRPTPAAPLAISNPPSARPQAAVAPSVTPSRLATAPSFGPRVSPGQGVVQASADIPRESIPDYVSPTRPGAGSLLPSASPKNAVESDGRPSGLPQDIARPNGSGSATSPGKTPPAAETREAVATSSRPLRLLSDRASSRIATMDSYIMQFRRREMVGSKSRPEEIILLKFRRNPWSAYLKWIGAEGKGREVTFVKGKYGNEMHMVLAAGDVPLMKAGSRWSISPDNFLVKSNSRYPITDAGIDGMIARFRKLVDANEKGDASGGALKYLGLQKRPEFDQPVHAVQHTLAPKVDPLFPRGGRRLWFFDDATHQLPVLVVAFDDVGREAEYYCHDRFVFPVRLDDDDFDPRKLFEKNENR